MTPAVPRAFDALYVAEQANGGGPLSRDVAFRMYREAQSGTVNPHRSFDAEWYGWQYPQAEASPSLFEHYLASPPDDAIDPAPWIDATLLKRQFDEAPGPAEILDLALKPTLRAEQGVTAGLADLCRVQRAFYDRIDVAVHAPPLPVEDRRRNLLWVQHGPNSKFLEWYDPEAKRSWDLAMNWYTGAPDPAVGDTILHQRGTKFSGIFAAARDLPGFFDGYDAVLFIDDDLEFEHGDIDRLFEVAARENLDLFQASVAEGSFCVWPALFHKSGAPIREVTGVEIMAPGFSGAALKRFISCFSLSVSGFGLDLLAGKLIRAYSGRVAVVDAVQMGHHAVIDQGGGAYYEFLRGFGINSKFELWHLMKRYNLEPQLAEVSKTGLAG
ncbi:hypothetical protein KHP62_18385 [Rhodobacteraceae bacterium NNCM2]|nr:hypothetical protein [Coraliihabitans acroporae]